MFRNIWRNIAQDGRWAVEWNRDRCDQRWEQMEPSKTAKESSMLSDLPVMLVNLQHHLSLVDYPGDDVGKTNIYHNSPGPFSRIRNFPELILRVSTYFFSGSQSIIEFWGHPTSIKTHNPMMFFIKRSRKKISPMMLILSANKAVGVCIALLVSKKKKKRKVRTIGMEHMFIWDWDGKWAWHVISEYTGNFLGI